MKIMMVGSAPGIGLTYRLAHLAEAFAKKGNEVHYLSFTLHERSPGLVDKLKQANVIIHLVPALAKGGLRALVGNKELSKLINEIKPDVIYNTGAVTAFQTKGNVKGKEPFRAATVRAFGHKWKYPKVGTFLGIILCRISKLDKIVVLCELEAKRLIEAGAKEEEIAVVNNSLECDDINHILENSEAVNIREAYKLPSNKKLLGCFASFQFRKRQDLLIRAFNSAANTSKDWCLLLVGNGQEKDTCEQLVDKLGISDKVIFYDRVPNKDVYPLIKSCDAIAHFSNAECGSMSMVEPLYLGKPTVLTDISYGYEFERDKVAVIVEHDNLEDMIEGVKRVMNPDEEVLKMTKRSPGYIKENFDVNVVADRLLRLFKEGIEEKQKNN